MGSMAHRQGSKLATGVSNMQSQMRRCDDTRLKSVRSGTYLNSFAASEDTPTLNLNLTPAITLTYIISGLTITRVKP